MPAQHQVLHGIEADCCTRDGVAHRGRDLIGAEHLHQSQNLDELSLALLTHPGFKKSPQRGELLRQSPAGQWRSLVECIDLLLDQRQVVQRARCRLVAHHDISLRCGIWSGASAPVLISFSFRLVGDQSLIGSGVGNVRKELPRLWASA
jgi:hypothetical protein